MTLPQSLTIQSNSFKANESDSFALKPKEKETAHEI